MKAFTGVSGTSWLQGRKLLPLFESEGDRARGTLLDLGCGSSPWRGFFSKVDEYIRMDRVRVDDDVIVIDSPYALPADDETVDTILLSRMLGDIPDQRGLMIELSRVLKPAGRVIVYEAISYPQHDLPHDYWRVLPQGLRWAAAEAGLECDRIEYLGGYFTNFAVHLNSFIIGDLGGFAATRPIAAILRGGVNLACAGLDAIVPRPQLATDYFACLTKPARSTEGAG